MTAGRTSSSKTTTKDWNTPPKYVGPITAFFGGSIDLDPCSNTHSVVNAKHKFTWPENDGLKEDWGTWGGTVFVNPPYGRDANRKTTLFDWVDKALAEWRTYGKKMEILFLIPVATNTRHFKSLVFKFFSAICFLEDTRLRFYNGGVEDRKGAPMACCLVYLGDRVDSFKLHFEPYGKCFAI
jgi:hypothetical protein